MGRQRHPRGRRRRRHLVRRPGQRLAGRRRQLDAIGPDNTGNDRLYGEDGDDRLDASDYGNNYLNGGAGNDALYGYAGNDVLEGGAGNDQLRGGSGNDTYRFTGNVNLGFDQIIDPSLTWSGGIDPHPELDTLDFSGLAQGIVLDLSAQNVRQHVNNLLDLQISGAVDHVVGTDFNDRITGNDQDNAIWGGKGNDILYGKDGNDFLYGEDGDDKLYGGSGGDVLYGGAGNDTLVSIDASAADYLYGEGGDDSFWTDYESGDRLDHVCDWTSFERANNIHEVWYFANGADKTFDGDQIADPTGGSYSDGKPVGTLYYRNFSNQPLFAISGPSELDIEQNNMGDCWLLATLGSAARTNPNSIRQTVVELGDGTYAVELGGKFYRVDGDLPTWSPTDTTLRFAGLGQSGSLWVAIVEKAYTSYRTAAGTYGGIDGGWPEEAFQAIGDSGFSSTSFCLLGRWGMVTLDAAYALNSIAGELDLGKAVVVNTSDSPSPGSPLLSKHSYMAERVIYVPVLDLRDGTVTNRPVSVVLRNPWGRDGAGNDGVDDGLVTVTGEQLLASIWHNGKGIQSAWVA